MRKLIVVSIVSLDGFAEGPGGDVLALPMDAAFDAYNAGRLRSATTLLLGANTYTGFQGFWPAVDGDPNFTPVHWEISRRDNEIDKVVVSDSLDLDPAAPWFSTTTLVRRADAHAHVAALKAEEGGDILVFGSRTLWNNLLAVGLVDEIHLIVGALALGGGTPAFAAPAALSLLEVRRLDGSDNHLVRYAPAA